MQSDSELFIVLSNLCNFRCLHCVTSSGPSEKNKYLISDFEITTLIRWIKNESHIKRIHFSGGEPTLFLDIIEKFQSELPEKSYAMTSNGWFGKNSEKIFSKIKLDVLYISYDKFHEPFIEIETLNKALDSSTAKGINTFVKLTVSDPTDFLLVSKISNPLIKIITNSLVHSGRAKTENLEINIPLKTEHWDKTCPSLLEERVDNLERIVFFPGKGLTPCCGPISEDKSIDQDFVYTQPTENYFEKNKLYKALKIGSFKEQNNLIYKNSEKHNSACSVCEMLYGSLDDKFLQKKLQVSKNDQLELIEIENQLTTKDLVKLSSKFKLAYILELSPSSFSNQGILYDNSHFNKVFEKLEINDKNSKVATNFFIDLFSSKFNSSISNSEIELLSSKLNTFLANSNSSFVFKSDGEIVGIIGAWRKMNHPLLKKTVNHIGVIGYNSKKLTAEDSSMLKKHWVQLIKLTLQNNLHTTARVDTFNKPSIKFFLNLGFKVSYLELTPI